jgi:hypothetical protein
MYACHAMHCHAAVHLPACLFFCIFINGTVLPTEICQIGVLHGKSQQSADFLRKAADGQTHISAVEGLHLTLYR